MRVHDLPMVSREQVCSQFGRLLARRRAEAKLSQRAFAKAVGLSRTSITNIERGRQPVSLPTLYAMAYILGRDIADLLPPIKALLSERTRGPLERDQLKMLSPKAADWLSKISEPQKRP